MKRLPLLLNVLAVVALSASLAYWALQLFKAPQRPIVAAPLASAPEPRLEAAAGLFGGQAVAVAVSSYQLRGVVAAVAGSPRSVAILAYDNQPAQALPEGAEVVAGVRVKEVHPLYVLLSEGGVVKRVDLATEAKTPDGGAGGVNVAPARVPVPMPVQAPTPVNVPVTAASPANGTAVNVAQPQPAGAQVQGAPTTPNYPLQPAPPPRPAGN